MNQTVYTHNGFPKMDIRPSGEGSAAVICAKKICLALAASLCAAACAFGAPKGKKPLYTNGEEAAKAAAVCGQPIMVFLTVRGSKQEALINRKVIGNKAFAEFLRENFVVWRAVQKLGKDNQPHLTGFSTNEVAMLKTFIAKIHETYHSVCAVLSPDGKKCMKGYVADGGMPAILDLETMPFRQWCQQFCLKLDSGNVPYEVTPAFKKLLETQDEFVSPKGGKKKKSSR